MAKVFLACPTHDGRIDVASAQGLFASATTRHMLVVAPSLNSLLSLNCNGLWAEAINQRNESGIEWFAMLHSDIGPEAGWLDKLIELAERHDADLMSTVVPIKDARGLTSTAIESNDLARGPFCRLTLRQVRHEAFPDTFDLEAAASALESLPRPLQIANVPRTKLVCNTGCLVCRLDRPWCDPSRVFFHELNAIAQIDGRWQAIVWPEDWFFTGKVTENGGRVMATKAVRVVHRGLVEYPSDGVWGPDVDEQSLRRRG